MSGFRNSSASSNSKCNASQCVAYERIQAFNRSEIGHWETDSVLCKYRDGVNVLAERMSRSVIITKLAAKDAAATMRAITQRLEDLRCKTITADNGSENAEHAKIARTLKALFFFCHPYHSWEKRPSKTATVSSVDTFPEAPTLESGHRPSLTRLPTTSTMHPWSVWDTERRMRFY